MLIYITAFNRFMLHLQEVKSNETFDDSLSKKKTKNEHLYELIEWFMCWLIYLENIIIFRWFIVILFRHGFNWKLGKWISNNLIKLWRIKTKHRFSITAFVGKDGSFHLTLNSKMPYSLVNDNFDHNLIYFIRFRNKAILLNLY